MKHFHYATLIAIHPMEGCDGDADGRPGELTWRRYERFARGGAKLIWFEATAIQKNHPLGQFPTGCPPFDKEAYGPVVKAAREVARSGVTRICVP